MFWSVIFSYSTQQPFLNQIVMCEEKLILYDSWRWSVQWLDWEGAPKHFLKANFHQKRSLLGSLLPVWSTTTFRIPVKPLHLRSMLSKPMRCNKNCKAYRQHWSIEWVQFFSMTTPYHRSHNQSFKSWRHWAMKFCFIHHILPTSHQPTTFLQAARQLFAGKMLPQPAGFRKCFPGVHWIPKHAFLCHRKK